MTLSVFAVCALNCTMIIRSNVDVTNVGYWFLFVTIVQFCNLPPSHIFPMLKDHLNRPPKIFSFAHNVIMRNHRILNIVIFFSLFYEDIEFLSSSYCKGDDVI